VSHLVLVDTGGDSRWDQESAPERLAGRGFGPRTVRLAERFLNGQIAPWEYFPSLMSLAGAYNPHTSLPSAVRHMVAERRSKLRPRAFIFTLTRLYRGWTVMDRLAEIEARTLVIAGRDDFLWPPEHQAQLAAGIPNAQLRIIERAGHNPHDEQPAQVMAAIRSFFTSDVSVPGDVAMAAM
jgi:proline iminopeptidase